MKRAPTEADALLLLEQPPKALTSAPFCAVRDVASLCLSAAWSGIGLTGYIFPLRHGG